ncbi:MAG TPA: DUF6134 family protein [Acetobacteraceae bacterium]|jgi:hypothetical protein|nr:DUF6134 family protein [Acetobacteraceae bacterium]
MQSSATRLWVAFLAILLACPIAGTAGSALAGTEVLDYRVRLAIFGDIGSYENRITTAGRITTVTSKLRCVVSLLGIVLHREDADRTERWQDGRLIYFDGTTTTNGHSVHVHGEARSDLFVVISPTGTVAAPAGVFPSNPWSEAFIHADTILHVTTGRIEPAKVVADGAETALVVAGKSVPATPYRIESSLTDAIVWVDRRGIPVLMKVKSRGHTVTLVLQSVTEQ